MTGSIALDVVIGLVFVYTLYSLLTTTFTEFIATWISLRSFFLAKGIRRMLDDGSGTKIFSDRFFNQPLIKYLGSESWLNIIRKWIAQRILGRPFIKKPAYLAAQNFSKNLNETLKEAYAAKIGTLAVARIREAIDNLPLERRKTLEALMPANNLLRLVEIHEIREEILVIKTPLIAIQKLEEMRADIDPSNPSQIFQEKLDALIVAINRFHDSTQPTPVVNGWKKEINIKYLPPITIEVNRNSKVTQASPGAVTPLATLQDCDSALANARQTMSLAAADEIIKQLNVIETTLRDTEISLDVPLVDKVRQVLHDPDRKIGRSETVRHIRSLLDDANNDLQKFAALLEQWYDDTMERVTGWYKELIQVITFFVGLCIAIVFNADTIAIVNTLSKDTDARDKLVQMASAYIESHPSPGTAPDFQDSQKKLDSLLKIKKDIEKDAAAANSVLGMGWDYPDSVKLLTRLDTSLLLHPANGSKSTLRPSDFYEVKIKILKDMCSKGNKSLQPASWNYLRNSLITLPHENRNDKFKCDSIRFVLLTPTLTRAELSKLLVYDDQWIAHYWLPWPAPDGRKHEVVVKNSATMYMTTSKIKFFWWSFWGYFLTAVAVSLGAPFWFDLLNKLVKLRTSIRVAPTENKSAEASTASREVPVTKRVG